MNTFSRPARKRRKAETKRQGQEDAASWTARRSRATRPGGDLPRRKPPGAGRPRGGFHTPHTTALPSAALASSRRTKGATS